MSKFNITFKNKKYSIDKSLLSGAISSIEAVLIGLSGGDVPTPTETLAPGLYQTGAIALYEEQGAEAIEGMMITSWDELLANGTVHVEDGVVYSNFNIDEWPDEWVNTSSDALAGDLVLPSDGSITALGDFNINDEVGNPAFALCEQLTGLYIPGSVMSISDMAFHTCVSLTSIMIPSRVTSIGWGVFSSCISLASIVIPDSVTSIGISAFEGCESLASITIPNSITVIDENAFSYCTSLESIEISDSVTSIGCSAFESCTALDSVAIGNGMTNIYDCAFLDCISLKSITYNGTIAQWNLITKGSAWQSGTGDFTVYCTDGNILPELPS